MRNQPKKVDPVFRYELPCMGSSSRSGLLDQRSLVRMREECVGAWMAVRSSRFCGCKVKLAALRRESGP